MREETDERGVRWFLGRHFEKLALGLAAAALLSYLLIGFNGAEAEAVPRGTRPSMPPPGFTPVADRAITTLRSVARADGAVDSAGTLLSKVISDPKPPWPKPPVRPTLMAGVKLTATAESPYAVRLEGEVRPVDPEKAKEARVVEVTGYALERRVRGTEAFASLREIGPGDASFTDHSVEAETDYEYRLVPRSGALRGAASVAAAAVPKIWSLRFQNAANGTVQVWISKIDRDHGRVEKRFVHSAGERIGWRGDSPLHWITRKGEPLQVDLDTGLRLVSAERETREVKVRRCLRRVKDTVLLPCVERTETRPVTTGVVVLESKEGRETRTLEDLSVRDERCPRHRGK